MPLATFKAKASWRAVSSRGMGSSADCAPLRRMEHEVVIAPPMVVPHRPCSGWPQGLRLRQQGGAGPARIPFVGSPAAVGGRSLRQQSPLLTWCARRPHRGPLKALLTSAPSARPLPHTRSRHRACARPPGFATRSPCPASAARPHRAPSAGLARPARALSPQAPLEGWWSTPRPCRCCEPWWSERPWSVS